MLLEVFFVNTFKKKRIVKQVFNYNIKSSCILVLFPKMDTFMNNDELPSDLTEVLNQDHKVRKTQVEAYSVFLRFMISQRKHLN